LHGFSKLMVVDELCVEVSCWPAWSNDLMYLLVAAREPPYHCRGSWLMRRVRGPWLQN